ncbi:CD151 antigen-like [Cherax quadricarinatus]|uniref:CD151 antigen-like n=1 Tax=Cherax quadricarinatus TaxID=27406 RepID=UPI00387E2702
MADHNLSCGPLTIKYLVFFFNLLFFLSGLALIIMGGIAQGFFSSYMQFFDGKYETPAIGLIILGSIILVISFFGCCGAKKENVFMLRIFAFLMMVILVLEFAAAITVAILRPDIETLLKENMNKTMENYGDDKSLVTKAWDDLQKKHDCCGTSSYRDWEWTKYGQNETVLGVPDSCCMNITSQCGYKVFPEHGTPSNIYTEGCYTALTESVHRNLGAIIGGLVFLALLQVCLIFF